MLRFETLFKNHFHTDKFGNDRLRAFSIDHINKLTAWLTVHGGAELTALRDELLLKHNAYFGCITDEITKENIRQGRTIAADVAWEKALDFIRRQEGMVRSAWGRQSGEYQEFYPNGLDEYNRATKLNKESLLQQYLSAATAHTATLGAPFVADFTALKNDWQAKFTQQQTQIGLVKDASSMTARNRSIVELQLCVNLLRIAAQFAGQPQMVNDFFNQNLLKAPAYKLPKSGILEPGKTAVAVDFITYDPEGRAQCISLSGGPFVFGLSHDGETFAGKTIEIKPRQKRKIILSELEVSATLLLVHNAGSATGRWKVGRG